MVGISVLAVWWRADIGGDCEQISLHVSEQELEAVSKSDLPAKLYSDSKMTSTLA